MKKVKEWQCQKSRQYLKKENIIQITLLVSFWGWRDYFNQRHLLDYSKGFRQRTNEDPLFSTIFIDFIQHKRLNLNCYKIYLYIRLYLFYLFCCHLKASSLNEKKGKIANKNEYFIF